MEHLVLFFTMSPSPFHEIGVSLFSASIIIQKREKGVGMYPPAIRTYNPTSYI